MVHQHFIKIRHHAEQSGKAGAGQHGQMIILMTRPQAGETIQCLNDITQRAMLDHQNFAACGHGH